MKDYKGKAPLNYNIRVILRSGWKLIPKKISKKFFGLR